MKIKDNDDYKENRYAIGCGFSLGFAIAVVAAVLCIVPGYFYIAVSAVISALCILWGVILVVKAARPSAKRRWLKLAEGIVLLLAGAVFIMFTAAYISIAAQTDVSPFRVDYL